MALLDLMRRQYPAKSLIVAHFDHNARISSRADLEFVQKICHEYELECITGVASEMGHLPETNHLSEANARTMRYDFLQKVSRENNNAKIYTAQHLDDLVESIAINLIRGTGWRGVAVMNRSGLVRPFLDGHFASKIYDRRDILRYAEKFCISFRQDPTNSEDNYLRNRIRPLVLNLPRETKEKLLELRQRQCQLAEQLQREITALTPDGKALPRQLFRDLPDKIALELLRQITEERYQLLCTWPQLRDFLQAIREYQPGKQFNLPGDHLVQIGREYF